MDGIELLVTLYGMHLTTGDMNHQLGAYFRLKRFSGFENFHNHYDYLSPPSILSHLLSL